MTLDGLLDAADGVLFDCDGVLVDSEPAALRAWSAALSGYGVEDAEPEISRFVGLTERDLAHHFAGRAGVDPAVLESAARAAFLADVAAGLAPFPDMLEFAGRLDGRPAAVGSNSFRWRLDAVLEASRLTERFPVSVAGDEVPRPKPAPDVYLRAASLLGVEPGRCLVLEDSPSGIEAASSAGCVVVAVDRGSFPADRLSAATLVIAG